MSMTQGPGRSAIIHVAAVFIVLAGIKAASSLLSLVMLAGFGAILTQPIFRYCRKLGLSEGVARVVTVGIVVTVVAGIGTIAVTSIDKLIEVAPSYGDRLNVYQEEFFVGLEKRGIDSEPIRASAMRALTGLAGVAGSAASGLVNLASRGMIIIILLMFFVLDGPVIGRTATHMLTVDDNPFRHAMDDILIYLIVKTKVSILTGVTIGVVLWILGLPFAFLLGLTVFALNYIPNIGSMIAAIPGVVVALVTGGPELGIWVFFLYGVVNIGVGSFLEPKLMGDQFGLPATVILLSLIFWGWLLGAAGALLAVPLTLACKLLFSRVEDWRWLSVALSTHEEE